MTGRGIVEPPRVLVLTETPELYGGAADHNVEMEFFQTAPGLIESMLTAPLNGVILEVGRLLRSSRHEQEVLREYLKPFPVLRVNVQRGDEGATLRPLGSMEQFLTTVCPEFLARTVRGGVRIRLHLPVLVADVADQEFARATPTYSLDVSQGGMFLFSARDWSGTDWVRLECPFLDDDTPFMGHIRWRKPWGGLFEPSGIGLMFMDMSDAQHAELCERFLLRTTAEKPREEEVEELRDALEAFLAGQGRSQDKDASARQEGHSGSD
jgi:Tfp pilus assembly protein PilZ